MTSRETAIRLTKAEILGALLLAAYDKAVAAGFEVDIAITREHWDITDCVSGAGLLLPQDGAIVTLYASEET